MRTPITLKIKFKSGSLEQFIERYSVDISRGGIFIRTKEPLSVGTPLKFEFQLQNASPLIVGEGTVVWTRDPDPSRSGVVPGMGVRFDKLTPASQQVLDRILADKASRGEPQAESRYEAGIQERPSVPGGFDDREAKTPLPQPTPGFGETQAPFDDDMTRVMQSEEANLLARRTREIPASSFEREERTVQIDAQTVQSLLAGTVAGGESAPPSPRVSDPSSETVAPPSASPPAAVVLTEAQAMASGAPVPEPAATPMSALERAPDTAIMGVMPETDEEARVPAPAPRSNGMTVGRAASRTAEEFRSQESSDSLRNTVAAQPPSAIERSPRLQARRSSSGWIIPAVAVGVVAVGGLVLHFLSGSPQTTNGPSRGAPPTASSPPRPGNPPAASPSTALPSAAGTTGATPGAPAAPGTTTSAQTVSASITTTPIGASLILDGMAQPGTTPMELRGLDPKKTYQLEIVLKGYKPVHLELRPPSKPLRVPLVRLVRAVDVSSVPGSAEVFLDGKKIGRTPTKFRLTQPDKDHQLEIRHSGYQSEQRAITTTDAFELKGEQEVLNLSYSLMPAAAKPGTPPKSSPEAPAAPTEAKPENQQATPTDKPPTESPPPSVPSEETSKASSSSSGGSPSEEKAAEPSGGAGEPKQQESDSFLDSVMPPR